LQNQIKFVYLQPEMILMQLNTDNVTDIISFQTQIKKSINN